MYVYTAAKHESPGGEPPVTWTRLHDGWTDSQRLMCLTYPTRWHYLSMIQWCSKNELYDGQIRTIDARRCSDLGDPDAALTELIDANLIIATALGYQVVHIDQHIPPPSVREASEKAKIRMRRMRQHRVGDHSDCLPENCDEATVTPNVTRNIRTGQDGSGQGTQQKNTQAKVQEAGPAVSPGSPAPSRSVTATVTRNTASSVNGQVSRRPGQGGSRSPVSVATAAEVVMSCDNCGSPGETRVDSHGYRICVGSCIQEGG